MDSTQWNPSRKVWSARSLDALAAFVLARSKADACALMALLSEPWCERGREVAKRFLKLDRAGRQALLCSHFSEAADVPQRLRRLRKKLSPTLSRAVAQWLPPHYRTAMEVAGVSDPQIISAAFVNGLAPRLAKEAVFCSEVQTLLGGR